MENKALIRNRIIQTLKSFRGASRIEETSQLLCLLKADPLYQKARTIAAYYPLPFELDVTPLFSDTTKIWLLPKIGIRHTLTFHSYQPSDVLMTNAYQLQEPQTSAATLPPDLLIVPGLAWNPKTNYRIGYGGGYYDRYLAHFKGNTLSLAYPFQLMDFIPEYHDIPIQKVIINNV